MKKNNILRTEDIRPRQHKWITWAPFMLAAILLLSPICSFGQEPEFCWRDSYGRGVGTIPRGCEPGQQRIGLLCYDKCPAGMKRFGFDCHSVCPAGLRDDGLFCRAAEYGRGAGYAIWNEDKCKKENKQGCEKNGAMWYPKCAPGYENFGCCICRPKKPNCAALGLKPGIDLSCAKVVTIGNPQTGSCPGEQKDAGLCYPTCKAGFAGVGPVCWGQPPPNWSECGMGAAKDSTKCATIILGQIYSVGNLAFNIASLGSSTSLTAGMSAPQKASRLAKLKQEYSALKVQFDLVLKNNQKVKQAMNAFDAANKGRKGYVATQTYKNAVTEEDMVRLAAQIAAILDPTGVASVVAAFTYPKCTKYFPQAGAATSDGTINWVAGSADPANASVGGQAGEVTLPVCRASYQGGVYQGKIVAGNCNIDRGGKEIVLTKFEVLIKKEATQK